MPELLQSLVVSASLGALIGTIRQWGKQKEGHDQDGVAGLRTFVLWALIGGVSAFLSEVHSPAVFPVALVLVGLNLILRSVFQGEIRVGFTTVAASLLVFFIGGLVQWGHQETAVVLSAITMLVLGLKQPIHEWTRKFTPQDIRSTLQFVAITGVILPIVPNKGYGPYEAFNPFSVWLMVVLISGLGFVGYILMRLMGARSGIAMTGLVGGLASSTATTLAFSRASRETPALSSNHAMAVVLACTVMLARVLVVLGFLHGEMVGWLWLPFLVMALPGVGYTAWIYYSDRHRGPPVSAPEITNPLHLSIAIKFALIYAVVSFLVKAVSASGMNQGLLVVAFVSGLTDMDAIALSMTNNVREGTLGIELATRAIILAAVANTLVKAGISVALGSPSLKRRVLLVLGVTMLVGLGSLVLVQ